MRKRPGELVIGILFAALVIAAQATGAPAQLRALPLEPAPVVASSLWCFLHPVDCVWDLVGPDPAPPGATCPRIPPPCPWLPAVPLSPWHAA